MKLVPSYLVSYEGFGGFFCLLVCFGGLGVGCFLLLLLIGSLVSWLVGWFGLVWVCFW